jgi:hypothetical protein
VPDPSPRIPLIVGGRSDAAVTRAARLGDGWLGIWVSPRRFASVRDHIPGRPARLAGTRARSSTHSTRGADLPPPASPLASCWRRRCRCFTRCPSSRSSATRRTARRSRSPSSSALYRGRLLGVQCDPVCRRRRERDRSGRRATTVADRNEPYAYAPRPPDEAGGTCGARRVGLHYARPSA